MRMAARVHALFGADPFGPPRRAVEARMGPATGKPRTTFADPAYAVYLRAQARIAGRIVAAFAKDTDRMVAGASGASVAELRFVLDPNTSSFQNVGQLVLFDLEANLKGAPLLEGADRARADEARRELESAATLASSARAAFDALRPRIEALDRKIKADAAAEDDDDPNTLMPDFLHWSRDLGYVEKRCREVAAALASKLAPGR